MASIPGDQVMVSILSFFPAGLGKLHAAKYQKGATLIEYALIVALIAVGVFLGAQFGVGDAIQGLFEDANTAITEQTG
tara:strand:+ start:449 stop:682 length:234 start_codon:yes stop_codon:yes gene_type:complete